MKKIILLLLIFSLNQWIFSQSNDCTYSGTAITVNADCSSTSTFNSTNNTDYWNSASSCNGTDNDDAWWWFTATSTSTTITYNSTNDAIMHLFTGACATNMSSIACADNTTSGDETITYATTVGVDYAIRVQRKSSDNNMNGTICVYSPPSGPTNDLICNASAVTCGNAYTGSTSSATTTGEGSLPACGGTSPGAAGLWYVFTGNGSTVTADLCTSGTYDTKINVYGGANCSSITSCVASNDDDCGTQSRVTFATSAGTNYYIYVNGYSGATGNFTLTLSCCTPSVPSCATLSSPANGATNISSCTNLTWSAPATSGCTTVNSYDVYYGTTNPPPFYQNVTGTSIPIACMPSTTYYWQIRPKNGMGSATGCTVRSFSSISSGNPNYVIVDDATSPSPYDCVTLTTTSNDQRGCSWDINSNLNFATNFSYDFTVNLGSSDAGADGLAFVMQNDPQGRCKCGSTGGAMGAGGISNSVIIEIDTYINYEDRDDFNTSFIGCGGTEDPDHLDIWFNGNVNPNNDYDCNATAASERPATPTAVRLKSGGSNYNIENGQNHILRISWDAASTRLTASVLNMGLTTTYGTISSIFNPMTIFGTNTPFFGFTASTGGLNNNQSFCNPPSLLPVEMEYYKIECKKDYNELQWKTLSERNHSYFIIESSFDGKNYEEAYRIYANFMNDNGDTYTYNDYETNVLKYYRLKQVDINGNVKIIDVVSSSCFKANELFVEHISQSNEQIELFVKNKNLDEVNIKLIDLKGKIAYTKEILLSENGEKTTINTTSFSKGLYFLHIANSKGEQFKKKMIVF